MLTEAQRRFLDAGRVARLATVDRTARPHVVPICYALDHYSVYFTIDEKPKRSPGTQLKRLSNLEVNPRAALVIDRYDEDWSRLGWVMLRGRADILTDGAEHDHAQRRLRERYPQLREMRLERLPAVAIRIETVTSWGRLEID